MRAQRLLDRPIISPDLHPSTGPNIQGPSLIGMPHWVEDRLGDYHLYFADHKGRYIRLAYADQLTGPWTIYPPGSLQLEQSGFLSEPPQVTPQQFAQFEAQWRERGVSVSHDLLLEITTPHIASPDVHIDRHGRQVVMYFHGLDDVGVQVTRVATSPNGIDFTALPPVLGPSYFRAFEHDGMTYALAMPGRLYRSETGLDGFEQGPTFFNPRMRHSAVLKRGAELWVSWTQVGDVPERILLSRIGLYGDWHSWKESTAIDILRPGIYLGRRRCAARTVGAQHRPWSRKPAARSRHLRGKGSGLLALRRRRRERDCDSGGISGRVGSREYPICRRLVGGEFTKTGGTRHAREHIGAVRECRRDRGHHGRQPAR
jgi:hypothetical protein